MMSFILFMTIFIMVFLAELGDKTQLMALAYTAGTTSPWLVFFAASSALVFSTLLAVLLGHYIHNFIPKFWSNIFAGALFLIFGVMFIYSAFIEKNNRIQDATPNTVKTLFSACTKKHK